MSARLPIASTSVTPVANDPVDPDRAGRLASCRDRPRAFSYRRAPHRRARAAPGQLAASRAASRLIEHPNVVHDGGAPRVHVAVGGRTAVLTVWRCGAGEHGCSQYRTGETEAAQDTGNAARHVLAEDGEPGEDRKHVGEQGRNAGRGEGGSSLE